MGQFFKFLFASCLGVLLAIFVIGGIVVSALIGLASEVDQPESIRPNSVLKLSLTHVIPERTNNLEMNPFEFQKTQYLGIHDLVYTINTAKEDDNIKGIYLEAESLPTTGIASGRLLFEALKDFKSSGKFIIAYSRYYTQGAYYIATTADEIILNPIGAVDFRGFSAQIPFMKNMLDKVGIKMQVIYAGKFKSATEPYRRTNMSDENRLQVRAYLEEMYATFLSDISEGRDIPVSELRKIADSYIGIDPDQALAAGLVDQIGYSDQALNKMRELIGLDSDEKVKMVSPGSYFKNKPKRPDYDQKDRIAVVYAEGTVVDGKGENGTIGDEKYVKILRDLRKNDRVKAIVLRINSPGGSAMSSENIWREIRLAQDAGKKVVASMGDYAASGGYYIAAPADTILAQSNTLTGSIGVFNVIPSVSELLEDKLGINFDTVKTGDLSTGITPVFDMSPKEIALLQSRTNAMYELFLKRVSEGRGMSRDAVHEIAQGRVWTGANAQKLGLVDQIGGLEDAIAVAQELAGLDGYRVLEYPAIKEPLQQLIEDYLMEEEVNTKALLKTQLGELQPYYDFLDEVRTAKGVQARLPFLIPFE